jgi:hypothetical protein
MIERFSRYKRLGIEDKLSIGQSPDQDADIIHAYLKRKG